MYKQCYAVLGLASLFIVGAACSSNDAPHPAGKTKQGGGTKAVTDGTSTDSGSSTPGGRGPDGRITPECEGFTLAGLKYSPGGDTLPNKCAPFDATTNNPYAVRCIDAMPTYKTGYPGDEYCILPPPS